MVMHMWRWHRTRREANGLLLQPPGDTLHQTGHPCQCCSSASLYHCAPESHGRDTVWSCNSAFCVLSLCALWAALVSVYLTDMIFCYGSSSLCSELSQQAIVFVNEPHSHSSHSLITLYTSGGGLRAWAPPPHTNVPFLCKFTMPST